tara:strand:- start:2884 stop:3015 length:132 start_codon:yes stop_codon:yes gene_type:complete
MTSVTDVIPMTIPRIVRRDLVLFVFNPSRDVLNVYRIGIIIIS